MKVLADAGAAEPVDARHIVRTAPRAALCRPPAPVPRAEPAGLISLLAALRRNPLECWAAEHFEKPIATVRLPVGRVLLVHEPAAIRRVLLDNAGNYQKDVLQRRVLSAGLDDGLLSAEGEQWSRQRRILAPLFARRTVNGFAPLMLSTAEGFLERWRALPVGTVVDISAEMALLTLNVLAMTIFSDGIGTTGGDAITDLEEFRAAMNAYFGVLGRVSALDLLGVPEIVPRPGRARLRGSLDYFRGIIDAMIAARQRRLAASSGPPPEDLLTLLLRASDPSTGQPMTEAEVRSNILTFLSAGHETTANALSWSLFLLSQSPEWRARVEVEADRELDGAAEDLAERLVVTRAVIDEAIRLYPPIAALSRAARRPDDLGGEEVRRHNLIVIAPYVLHRHRLLWDAPETFDPGRFLGVRRQHIHRFGYLPFGVGPRICIGQAFALQEATLMLATLVRRFRLALAPGAEVWPLLRVTLRPAHGLPMVLAAR